MMDAADAIIANLTPSAGRAPIPGPSTSLLYGRPRQALLCVLHDPAPYAERVARFMKVTTVPDNRLIDSEGLTGWDFGLRII